MEKRDLQAPTYKQQDENQDLQIRTYHVMHQLHPQLNHNLQRRLAKISFLICQGRSAHSTWIMSTVKQIA